MSKSLSQSAANTILPTKVRASVGSRMSGSSASPKRKVCALARLATATVPAVSSARIVHNGLLMAFLLWHGSGSFVGDISALRSAGLSRSRRPFGASERSLQALEARIRADRRSRQHCSGWRDLAPEMTRHGMFAVRGEPRILLDATPLRVRAARPEAASVGRVERAGHIALEDDALAARSGPRHRYRGEQGLRVRVPRVGEQLALVRVFHDASQIHHRYACGDVLHDGEIVSDENVRQPEPLLEIGQEIDDLRLDRDVERGHWLVADDELRLRRERARDADALPLSAGELVRITLGVLRCQADELQQLGDTLAMPAGRQAVQRKRLVEHLAHRHARVERRVRILKHDLQRAPAGAQLGWIEGEKIAVFEVDRTGGRLDQAQDQSPR